MTESDDVRRRFTAWYLRTMLRAYRDDDYSPAAIDRDQADDLDSEKPDEAPME